MKQTDTQDTQKKGKTVPVPICLTPEILVGLDAEAVHEGIFRGRSVIVRRACAEYLERRANARKTAAEGSQR